MRPRTMSQLGTGRMLYPSGESSSRLSLASRFGGELIEVIERTDYSFDGRTTSNQDIVLATGIDSRRWKSGAAIIRLHAKSGWSASAILSINIDNISLTPEDPSVVFTGSRVASPQILAAAAAPLLVVSGLTLAAIGPQLQVSLRWSQGATAAGAAQTLSLSIDLVGRPR